MHAEFLLSRERNRRLEISEVKKRAYRPHFHSHVEISAVLEGEMEVWINDRRRQMQAGEIAVAWSYDAHAYQSPKDSNSISIIIPLDYLGDALPMQGNRQGRENFFSDPALFRQILDMVYAARESKSELIRRGYVYVILGMLLEQIEPEEDEAAQTDATLTSRVLLYLNEHFHEPLTLSSVAGALGYNANYLSRLFRDTLRISFHQYLMLLRLREMVILMKKGGRTVTECAYESGFQSLRTFYRAFQEEFGCAPRDFFERN